MKQQEKTVLFFSLLISKSTLISATAPKTIEQSCSVITDKGKVDLKPLAKTDGTSFAFVAFDDTDDIIYYWNPCSDSTLTESEGACTNVEMCEYNEDESYYESLASKSDASFTVTGEDLILNYGSDFGSIRITLKCGKTEDEFSFMSNNNFQLTSKHACYQPLPTKSPSKGSSTISAGTIICIIALSVAALYLIIGVLVMKYMKKAHGAELCPNSTYWRSLPGLVKDGTTFVVRRGKSKPGTYESI